MSASATPDGAGDGLAAIDGGGLGPLVVVSVTETVVPALTGRSGCRYTSPPQPREQAMTLVRLLLGHVCDSAGEEDRWTAAIAGGRRLVTLSEEPIR